MRKLLIGSLVAFSLHVQAQTVDPATNLLTYSEVVEVNGVGKNELYVRANTWFTRAFKNSKAVLQLEDKEAGKLIGKGNISTTIKVPIVGMTDAGYVDMTVTVQCKDGKYKYTIDNLNHQKPLGPNTQYWVSAGPLEQEKPKVGLMGRPSKKEWSDLKEDADITIKAMIADLKKAMAKADADF